jgi:hypothetical protein
LVYEEVAFVAERVCGLEEDKTAPRGRRAFRLRKGIPTVYIEYFSFQSIGRRRKPRGESNTRYKEYRLN